VEEHNEQDPQLQGGASAEAVETPASEEAELELRPDPEAESADETRQSEPDQAADEAMSEGYPAPPLDAETGEQVLPPATPTQEQQGPESAAALDLGSAVEAVEAEEPEPPAEPTEAAEFEDAGADGDLKSPEPAETLAAVSLTEPDDGRLWYVVHCYSGYENKVRHNLEQRIETMNMKDKIFDVVVPTEEEMEVREGKRRTVERRVFPGYILVQMIMNEDSWYVVRNTPGVTGFVGMGNEPTALRPEEVSQIIRRMEAEAPRIKVTYKTGQKVRIIDGPFNDFIGTVDAIDMDRAKVRVMVSFFGRETPVELDFLQVEKA
jgi:transcriptional antiterminator NusG